MELNKFSAASMKEALAQVRAHLGDDAVILESRTVREVDGPGLPAVERVEVWAHLPEDAAAPTAAPTAVAEAPVADSSAEIAQVSAHLQTLEEQLKSVHIQLGLLTENMHWLGAGASGAASELVHCVAESLAQRLPVSGGIQLTGQTPHVVALVGPTGVGKTTTLAKLAWRISRHHRRNVGVITTDTFRIGALDQIRIICREMDVPLEVVCAPEQMPEALAKLADCAFVLIDTPGGSQRNAEHLALLHDLLLAADPAEVHLVLSACLHPAVLREVMGRYRTLHPEQVIFTKLDETTAPLEIFPLILGSGLAISYLSAGQSIPDDLHEATTDTVAQYLARE